MEKRDLRPLAIEALRQEQETQFSVIHSSVAGMAPDYDRAHDELLVREIIWELLGQGILAPGLNHNNLEFPFVHVTEYGTQCLEVGDPLPHDPDGYIARLQDTGGHDLDEIVLMYVRESLQTFLADHYLAAAVMLGVASERCIDLLIEAFQSAIADQPRKSNFERKIEQAGRSVKRRFDALRDELVAISLPPELADALDIQLSGVFTLIRYSRNDAGHPAGSVVDRDVVHGNLLLFPQYCMRAYALLAHFGANQI